VSARRQIDAFFPKKPQRGLSEIRVRAPRQERGIVTTRSAGGRSGRSSSGDDATTPGQVAGMGRRHACRERRNRGRLGGPRHSRGDQTGNGKRKYRPKHCSPLWTRIVFAKRITREQDGGSGTPQ